ncbi:MAG TPA: PilZ domain-containing protein [Candidatus Saccharimonadales bacterium]|nr:PilZ domain-containing protein [Candidatus Saccharimonadales bacterium]
MPTILIADESGLFKALETSPTLRSACRIVTVRSCRELLASAASQPPDLFLLDAEHLGQGARDCLRGIKADRRLATVPIVMAAASPGPFEGLLKGRDRLFAKPVAPDEVGQALTQILPLARRSSRRVPLSVPVTCTREGEAPLKARSKDVATGGIFIRTPWEPAEGTRFSVTFSLPPASGGMTISATCVVVRRVGRQEPDRMSGVGASIVEIDDNDAGALRRFVTSAG